MSSRLYPLMRSPNKELILLVVGAYIDIFSVFEFYYWLPAQILLVPIIITFIGELAQDMLYILSGTLPRGVIKEGSIWRGRFHKERFRVCDTYIDSRRAHNLIRLEYLDSSLPRSVWVYEALLPLYLRGLSKREQRKALALKTLEKL